MGRFAAQHLLPAEGGYIQTVPRQVHRESGRGRIAERQALAVRRDLECRRNTYAGRGAVVSEADVVIKVHASQIDNLAVGRSFFGRVDLELFQRIGDPAGAEAFPCQHFNMPLAEHSPHGHLIGTGVGRRHDGDFVVGRYAQNFARRLDRFQQLGFAGCGAVASAQGRVRQLCQIKCGGFGAWAGRKTRIRRPRGRCSHSHVSYPLR